MAREKAIASLFLELRAKGDKLKGDVNRALTGVESRVKKLGGDLQGIGRTVTTRVSAPLMALSGGIIKVSADFEEMMNTLNANSRATAEEFEQLRKAAKSIGGDQGVPGTARDAAVAMDMLARNGVKANKITRELTIAMLRLAKATGGEFGLASDIATDAAAMFGKTMEDVDEIANGVLGVTLQSKIAIEDYALALAQGGGAAGNAGQSLKDFNAGLAATAFMFKSGAGTGTSYAQFMQSLAGVTNKQIKEQERLGLKFFDSEGKIKPLIEITRQLEEAFADLTDQERILSSSRMFGAKAARTGAALSITGVEGIRDILNQLDGIAVGEALEKREKGFNATMRKVKKGFANLFVVLGDSGMLAGATRRLQMLADGVARLAEVNPQLLKFVGIAISIGAVLGPAIIALGFFVSALGTLLGLLSTLGVVGAVAIGALVLFGPQLAELAKQLNLGPAFEKFREAMKSIGLSIPEPGVILDKFIAIREGIFNFVSGVAQKIAGAFDIDLGPLLKIGAIVLGVIIFFNPLVRIVSLLARGFVLLGGKAGFLGGVLAKLAGMNKGLLIIWGSVTAVVASVIAAFQSASQEGGILSGAWKLLSGSVENLWISLKGLWGAIKKLVGTIDDTLAGFGGLQGVFENIAVLVAGALVAAFALLVQGLDKVVKILTTVVEGFDRLVKFVVLEVNKLVNTFKNLADMGIKHLKRLVGYFDVVKGGVKKVGDGFRWLHDKVVGNSWIPDLVDGVIKHGKRMARDFFEPTKVNIKSVEQKFSELANVSINELNDKLDALYERFNQSKIGGSAFNQLAREIKAVEKQLDLAQSKVRGFNEQFKPDMFKMIDEALFNRASEAVDSLIDGTKKWDDALRDLAANFLADIAKMIAKQMLFNAIMGRSGGQGQGGSNDGITNAVLSGVGALLGFASGGRPPVGRGPVKVGESGPEMFIPDVPGTILSNDQMNELGSQGPPVMINNHYAAGTSEEVRRQAEKEREITLQILLQAVQQGGDFRRAIQG